ncbi:hypothetical protein MHU86_23833 [Fragilaria crotonensis]|nr:hypothetical protein MHU86_23833 [Fragilaria crotonensis]
MNVFSSPDDSGGTDGASTEIGNPVLLLPHVGLRNVGRAVVADVFCTGNGVGDGKDVELGIAHVGCNDVGDDEGVCTLMKLPNEAMALSKNVSVLSVPSTDATAKLK